jgi:hypothetical protein
MRRDWGGARYTPVKGDFDGDGRADLAFYESNTGYWYILLSGSNHTTTITRNWGGRVSGRPAVSVTRIKDHRVWRAVCACVRL